MVDPQFVKSQEHLEPLEFTVYDNGVKVGAGRWMFGFWTLEFGWQPILDVYSEVVGTMKVRRAEGIFLPR